MPLSKRIRREYDDLPMVIAANIDRQPPQVPLDGALAK